jgi:hypothetical protein
MKRKNNREVYDNNGKKRDKHWKHEGIEARTYSKWAKERSNNKTGKEAI